MQRTTALKPALFNRLTTIKLALDMPERDGPLSQKQ